MGKIDHFKINNIMKATILIFLIILSNSWMFAQNKIAMQPRMFVSSGFVTPQFFSGIELLSSYALRKSDLSYFENGNGNRKNVGNYSSNTGFSLSIGYYVPIKKVKGLSIGLLVNSGQTGSNPSEGGYNEAFFFNFINFGMGVQYYPFTNNNFYLKGEIAMGSVLTKNRFVNEDGNQDFLHYFGIGTEGGGSIGYTITPFKNKMIGINVEGQYQLYSTRVEVSGVGDDQWKFGALHLSVGLQF
jgi:hypothetical protein